MSFSDYASFYINLDSSTERRAQIEEQLQRAGFLHAKRISGYDGRGIDLASQSDFNAAWAHRHAGRYMKGGEYGCYRGHLAALSAFVESGQPYGFIFEDDALIDPALIEVVGEAVVALQAAGFDWDILHLSAGELEISTQIKGLSHQRQLLKAHHFPMLATALLWSRSGALSFLEQHRYIWMPVDRKFREVMTSRQTGFMIWPELVRASGVASDIHAGPRPRRRHGKLWYYVVTKKVYRWRTKALSYIHKLRFRGPDHG